MKRFVAAAALLALGAPAVGQEVAPAAASSAAPAAEQQVDKVQVSSIKDPELRPYRHMVRGLDAWEQKRPLAPHASLRFELLTADGKPAAAEGLRLRLAGDKVDIPLPIEADGTFTLPRSEEAYDGEADLVLNRKKNQIRWRPHVRTPGVPENARRLGDLRLECEVSAAIRREEIPLLYRAGGAAFGGICNVPMVGYIFRSPMRLLSATVVSGERKEALQLHEKGAGYMAPLRDRSWDDDALVVYEFAEPAASTP